MLRLSALSLALVCSIASLVSAQSIPGEARQRDFVIQNDDGYGTSDCLSRGSACGKIVADAWCEAKGFARAVAYRPAEAADITHSIRGPQRQSPLADSFVISCSE
ncbi:MAG TPA: hypothetical protein PLQ11_04485 [Beijerinckiaceae bacterium]|nr:hypothetical protein [Beijerinckiaceae bacterium]